MSKRHNTNKIDKKREEVHFVYPNAGSGQKGITQTKHTKENNGT
jgi:hypothetical protein